MKYFYRSFFLLPLLGFVQHIALAQSGGSNGSGGGGSNGAGGVTPNGSAYLTNPLKAKSLTDFLLSILDVILVFAVPIIVLFIMYAGFLYVTAAGDENKIKKAHAALLWAVVGGVIVLGARLIIDVIQGTVQSL